MALIVSDGTGLDNADSYISLADARLYAEKYGYTLPLDDTEAEVSLRKGAVYVDLFEGSFSGYRLVDTQSLAWPRKDSYKCTGQQEIHFTSDTVPLEAQYAQVIAANYYAQGLDVRANDDGLGIQSEEVVGAVKVAYFDNGKTGGSVTITEAEDMLSSLMCSCGAGFTLKTVRT